MVEKIIEEGLRPYEAFGVKELENGTRLIAEAKFIAPMAYVHSVFKSLNNVPFEIEKNLDISLPLEIQEFYQFYNGLTIFNGAFYLFGLRSNNIRSVDEAQSQPFSILTSNRTVKNILVIGGYSWNGSRVIYDLADNTIALTPQKSDDVLLRWENMNAMLQDVILRLSKLHTADGKNIPLRPTVPIGGKDVLERLINKERKIKPYWYDETIRFMNENEIGIDDLFEL
ncbi:MAG: SMI1/KNR4 family protein [Marinoscillum sp.]